MKTKQDRRAELVAELADRLEPGADGVSALVRQIADQFGCSTRTIYRDIAKLRAGQPIARPVYKSTKPEIDEYLRWGTFALAHGHCRKVGLTEASLSTWTRAIKREVPDRVRASLRDGHKAVQAMNVVMPRPDTVRNELWEIDSCHLPLNVQVDGALAKQVWLVLSQDHATRAIVGWSVVFGCPGAEDIALHLVRAALGTVTTNGTLIGGIPDRIHTDQGADYLSKRVYEVGDSLRTLIHALEGRTPQAKGTVERTFSAVAHEAINALPGRTNGPRDRADDPHTDGESIKAEDLIAHFDEYFRFYNEERVHDGIGMAPEAAWVQSAGEIKSPTVDQIAPYLTDITEVRTVSKHGIEYRGDYYKCDALSDHHRALVSFMMVPGARSIEVFLGPRHLTRAIRGGAMSPAEKDEMLVSRGRSKNAQRAALKRRDEVRAAGFASEPLPAGAQTSANKKKARKASPTTQRSADSIFGDGESALDRLRRQKQERNDELAFSENGQGQLALGDAS